MIVQVHARHRRGGVLVQDHVEPVRQHETLVGDGDPSLLLRLGSGGQQQDASRNNVSDHPSLELPTIPTAAARGPVTRGGPRRHWPRKHDCVGGVTSFIWTAAHPKGLWKPVQTPPASWR